MNERMQEFVVAYCTVPHQPFPIEISEITEKLYNISSWGRTRYLPKRYRMEQPVKQNRKEILPTTGNT